MVTSPERVVLLLQGPATAFFSVLADSLTERRARVLRICLSAGDRLRWGRRAATDYRGHPRDWELFLESYVAQYNVTDIVYYADRPFYHRVARDLANRLGLNAYVVENGYLRPDWVTLERAGMGTYSHFPTDPATIMAIGATHPDPDLVQRYQHPFPHEAWQEVSYNLTNSFARPLYPHFDSGRYYPPLLEYGAWVPRLVRNTVHRPDHDGAVQHLNKAGRRFFLFPLQLQSDYQIRDNSPFRHLADAVDLVFASFARRATPDTDLLVKVHPHDCGVERFPARVAAAARKYGLAGRVHVVSGGALGGMLLPSLGVVTVNSTVGLHGILASKRVKVLGVAVFDIAGLTHQGPLDDFWTDETAPDPVLRSRFIRALAGTIQVKGSLYGAAGMQAAAEGVAERIMSGTVNCSGAFVDPPPRLARARALGMTVDAVEPVIAARVLTAA